MSGALPSGVPSTGPASDAVGYEPAGRLAAATAHGTDRDAVTPRSVLTGDSQDGVLESRIPAGLNPWGGVGVVALHSHTVDEVCDERCSVHSRRPLGMLPGSMAVRIGRAMFIEYSEQLLDEQLTEWYNRPDVTVSIDEFVGLSSDEYTRWLEHRLSDDELASWAARIGVARPRPVRPEPNPPTGGTFDVLIGGRTRTLRFDATMGEIDAAVTELMQLAQADAERAPDDR